MIKLTIDYGWAGCHEEFDLDDLDGSESDEEIEKYVQDFVQEEIWNKVSWEWERQ